MEAPGNNQMPIQCRSGCGFYGTSATEGMCSKCYKDYLKKRQAPPSASGSSSSEPPSFRGTDVSISLPPCIDTASPTVPVILPSLTPSSTSSLKESGGAEQDVKPDAASGLAAAAAAAVVADSSDDPAAAAGVAECANQPCTAGAAGSADAEPCAEESPDKKKKNRCAVCKKRVGLTGFGCRCGGLFCAVHRYSDKHDCSFDYRTHGAEEIRKNNPVVKGEKVKQI